MDVYSHPVPIDICCGDILLRLLQRQMIGKRKED